MWTKRKEFSSKRRNKVWGGYSESIEMLLVFGFPKECRRVLMKKKRGDNRIKKFYSEMCRNTV